MDKEEQHQQKERKLEEERTSAEVIHSACFKEEPIMNSCSTSSVYEQLLQQEEEEEQQQHHQDLTFDGVIRSRCFDEPQAELILETNSIKTSLNSAAVDKQLSQQQQQRDLTSNEVIKEPKQQSIIDSCSSRSSSSAVTDDEQPSQQQQQDLTSNEVIKEPQQQSILNSCLSRSAVTDNENDEEEQQHQDFNFTEVFNSRCFEEPQAELTLESNSIKTSLNSATVDKQLSQQQQQQQDLTSNEVIKEPQQQSIMDSCFSRSSPSAVTDNENNEEEQQHQNLNSTEVINSSCFDEPQAELILETNSIKTSSNSAADDEQLLLLQEEEEEEEQEQQQQELTPKILAALSVLVKSQNQLKAKDFETHPIAGVGENSYGLVLRVVLKTKSKSTIFNSCEEFRCVLKIAPQNPARRSHMRVADYYKREVFMYEEVFNSFRTLWTIDPLEFDIVPKLLYYSLDEPFEFIIFEDLTQSDYIVGQRTNLPDYPTAAMALRTLSKLHARSFALQVQRKEEFRKFIMALRPDNLFTPDIEPLSIEFGKSYIRRARNMIQTDDLCETAANKAQHIEALENVEKNFKRICLRCVNGYASAPYAVICHGDFWSNNILNKYDHNNALISAKLIDFQMSRYASPVLDLVHYLFVCTARDLRKSYFHHLLYEVYYYNLDQQLQYFGLDITSIYPRRIFDYQLRNYGVYGLCMAAFSLPFFVADTVDLPDLDKVSEAIKDIGSTTETETANTAERQVIETTEEDLNESRLKLIEEDFNLLTARTAPVFKSRMLGIIEDMVKYRIKTLFY